MTFSICQRSKLEKWSLRTIESSPFKIIGEVISVLRGRAEEKGVGLDFKAVSKLPEKIKNRPPSRLRQVITNLVGKRDQVYRIWQSFGRSKKR